jgi:soluble lytic murein transglycosylase
MTPRLEARRADRRRTWRVPGAALCLALASFVASYAQQPGRTADIHLDADDGLGPTIHPPIPATLDELWLVPSDASRTQLLSSPGVAGLARGVEQYDSGRFAAALPLVSASSLGTSPLAPYAAYYTAATRLRLSQFAEARRAFAELRSRPMAGYLTEAALLGEAEAAEGQGDYAAAVGIYEQLMAQRSMKPEDAGMKLARALELSGHKDRAVNVLLRVLYEFALTEQAPVAESELGRLGAGIGATLSPDRFKAELGRGERLFATRRYSDARRVYETIRPHAEDADDRELVGLRLAECDHYLRRHRAAVDGLTPYIEHASRLAEARFFYLTSAREVGNREYYVRLAHEFVRTFPESSWSEEVLNNLASHYIRDNEDDQADQVFRELIANYPESRHAERASWKVGWWSYKNGRFDDAARVFEAAAARYDRSDYRPAYLYWAARAHDRLNNRTVAGDRYALVTTDYLNSYYGRLASGALASRGDARARGGRPVIEAATTGGSSDSGSLAPEPRTPPNAAIVRHLISAGLLADAERELLHAQRLHGELPVVQATLAWIYNRNGEYRRGTLLMKRAYPQHLAAGGEDLPAEMLRVVFPLHFWPLIRAHAQQRKLDPYLMTALVAQESTFIPDIRSSANAIGLMQIIPSTGRRYARTLGIRRFSPAMLARPDTNVRLGTAYFSDLVRRFGDDHLALASYNAGEHQVSRWLAERPGLDREEFIDDIPFPETQNYVKRILGMAEDYRRLYGGPAAAGVVPSPASPSVGRPTPPAPAERTSASPSLTRTRTPR